jgi:hypothetical protein
MTGHVHFADELTTECVDDTGDRGLLALADEVEVEHTLDGTGLQTAVRTLLELGPLRVYSCGVGLLDEASCLGVEERVRGGRAHGPAGSSKTADVVVGGEAIAARLGRVPSNWRCGGGHGGRMSVN